MDKSPFLEVDLLDLSEKEITELKKFTKTNFDISKIKSKVDDLKYAHDIHKILSDEIESPSEDFVRVITKQAYSGVFTKNVKDKFYKIIKNEFKEVINEKVEIRLNNALEKNNTSASQNAQRYFKKYSKSRTAIVEKNKQLEETDIEIKYLDSVLTFMTTDRKSVV